MASHVENILIRRIAESVEAPVPPVTAGDVGTDYDFRGIIRLKRVLTSDNDVDSGETTSRYEYVFDIITVNKFQKEV